MEKRVLILTNPSDAHALAVREVLLCQGVETHVWHTSDFPIMQYGSLILEQGEITCELTGSGLALQASGITTIWNSRSRPPVLPDSLHDSDRIFAGRECNVFIRSVQQWAGRNAFWVNPPQSQWRANLKPEQLYLALRSGFKIPNTLCSNDPRRIRDFVRRFDRGVVYKPFFPAAWRSQEGLAVTFTSLITEADLPEDDILRTVPGIFQEYVEKAYELRVTVVGAHVFAAKFRSQEVPAGKVDWRSASGQIPLEAYDLSSNLATSCHRLMAELGIVFGCFDLIVTPGGECVFLEVNEMGAFLWIEERLPELELLDCFCELLTQGRADFSWRRSGMPGKWSGVVEKALRPQEVPLSAHVPTTSGTTFNEATGDDVSA